MFQSNHASSLNQFCPSYISFDSPLPMKRVQQSFNFLKDYGSYYLLLQMFNTYHCLKSIQIQSFFWSEYRKIRTRKNLVFGHYLNRAERME